MELTLRMEIITLLRTLGEPDGEKVVISDLKFKMEPQVLVEPS